MTNANGGCYGGGERAMNIPDLLWEVKEREGHKSIAEMARAKSLELEESISPGSLYSWMTRRERHQRRPYAHSSLRIISRITGRSIDDLLATSDDGLG